MFIICSYLYLIIKTMKQEREDRKMTNWRVWILTDANGNELARGRKKDVTNVLYKRYVYGHIFDDCLYQTKELLNK